MKEVFTSMSSMQRLAVPDRRLGIGAAARGLTLMFASALLGACVVEQPYYDPGQPDSQVYAPPAAPAAYADDDAYDGGGAVQVYVRASVAPPPLPVYEQPPCPAAGYLWTPGYWAYGPEGYFWVPGTWVLPPRVGVLWTPGYWGWSTGFYVFHAGYWGSQVGFYGGVDYGGGYVGRGFVGGRWDRDEFVYNRAVMNVDARVVHNTYNQTVINNTVINNVTINRVSYVGGPGGLRAAPTPQERRAARETHIPRTLMQTEQVRAASADRAQFVKYNGGRPPIAATPRPRAFDSPHVVPARGAVMPPRSPMGSPGDAIGSPRGAPAGAPMPRDRGYGYGAGAPAQPQRPTYPLQRPAPERAYPVPNRGAGPVPAQYRPVERPGVERRPQAARSPQPARGLPQPAKRTPQKIEPRKNREHPDQRRP